MMRFSPVFKSSPHCLPSPDGRWIATILSSHISIRAVESLDVTRTIKLPADLAGSITTLIWSPTAERILLTANDEIHVFSATGGDYHATIRNSSSIAKSAFVDFGATDREACIYSAHGIKLSLFNLSSSKVVEISNPKFYTASSAPRGFSFRPQTHHLALLTRTSGKDTISVHAPESRQVQRSWSPDLVDAQGLSWTPNGRWLVVWESASQGHKVLFFTPDGHKYRDWSGPPQSASADMHDRLGAGVKLVAFSADSHYIAIADYGRCIYVLPMANMTDQLRLCHPLAIEPKDTLQIWQEQFEASNGPDPVRKFVKASQPVAPAARAQQNPQELKTGPHIMLFDSSAALLAITLEDAPSTLWIWDVSVSELRAVIMFHADISRVDWHPLQPELLLVKCEGQDYNGVVFTWDPLSGGPGICDLRTHLPESKISGRSSTYWLQSQPGPASLFFADSKHYLLGSMVDTDEDEVPWGISQPAFSVEPNQAARSPRDFAKESDGDESDMGEGVSQLDDTFHFKNFPVE